MRATFPRNSTLAAPWLALAATALAVGLAFLVVAAGAGASSSGGVGSTQAGEEKEEGRDRNSAGRSASGRYGRVWNRISVKERRWARRTARCESGKDPNAIGGGGLYRGAFQFMKSTWKNSPKSPGGDPIDYPYRTQAVVAVLLKRRDGAGHWPVCG